MLTRARASIASLHGPFAEELIRDQVRQRRDANARQKRLENLLSEAYRALPSDNRLATIPGIGDVTAAVLTAVMLDIDRFATPAKLVAYFAIMPTETSSGIDRDGAARNPRRFFMSPRGNDLVRRYLWMAGLSAIRFNPAVRALYARVVAKNPEHKGIAVGHAMRKLVHLVFAIWKSGKPFDANHYPWENPAHAEAAEAVGEPIHLDDSTATETQAAGRTPDVPARSAVSAACEASVPGYGRMNFNMSCRPRFRAECQT